VDECEQSVTPEPTPDPVPRLEQLSLFADICVYEVKPKFARQKPRRKKKPRKGPLQYKMQWRIRVSDRKITFRHRPKDDPNLVVGHFSENGAKKLHAVLLEQSLIELRNCAFERSGRVAEILQWIMRRDCDEPFSFETCVVIAGEFDPELRGMEADVIRRSVLKEIEANLGGVPPHRELLRHAIIDADYGDHDALEWMRSVSTDDLSFVDCCEAMGFSPIEARRQLGITPAQSSSDDHAETIATAA
jgi:hypothetical protein